MKSIIPGVNLKVFSRAIQSLSKFGDELYIEPLQDGLAIRTVNSQRSGFASFVFLDDFFSEYDEMAGHYDTESPQRCKLGMKTCLNIFKCVKDKGIEKCKMNLNMDVSRFYLQFHCKFGILKTYNLAFMDSETLQAIYNRDDYTSSFISQSKLMSDVAQNFPNNQEEISFILEEDMCTVKNYIEDAIDCSKVLRTEIKLDRMEFDDYRHSNRILEITFCLKEFRGILMFSDIANLPISMFILSPGKPVIISLDSDSTFEATFVLATVQSSSNEISQSLSRVALSNETMMPMIVSHVNLHTSTTAVNTTATARTRKPRANKAKLQAVNTSRSRPKRPASPPPPCTPRLTSNLTTNPITRSPVRRDNRFSTTSSADSTPSPLAPTTTTTTTNKPLPKAHKPHYEIPEYTPPQRSPTDRRISGKRDLFGFVKSRSNTSNNTTTSNTTTIPSTPPTAKRRHYNRVDEASDSDSDRDGENYGNGKNLNQTCTPHNTKHATTSKMNNSLFMNLSLKKNKPPTTKKQDKTLILAADTDDEEY